MYNTVVDRIKIHGSSNSFIIHFGYNFLFLVFVRNIKNSNLTDDPVPLSL
jgi:hypothetical protein